MPIKLSSIDPIPMIQGDGQLQDEMFATLQIFHNGNQVAAPRVPLADLPEGAQIDDFLKLVKAE